MLLEFALQEAAETKMSEVSEVPKFFENLKETTDNPDAPVTGGETDESTTIYLITRNESLEGDVHPITGVPFERKTIDLGNGEIIEGVFPEFESVFDAKIPEDLYLQTDYKQFKVCNEQLSEAIEANPDLKAKFTKDQLEQIKDGISDGGAPDGYVWRHCPEPGRISLVDYETHACTGHTGGRSVWGGGNENR